MKTKKGCDFSDIVRYKKTIEGYKRIKKDYDLLAEYLQTLFRTIAQRLDIYPIIQGRAKSLESFAEKIQRPGKNYSDPLAEITDFCGVRFITHTLDEVDRVERVLEEYFILDVQNSQDKQRLLAVNTFGYLSRHYIIQLKDIKKLPGFNIKALQKLKDLKAELQLRTMAQHMWADNYHELGYKNEFTLPQRWERQFARIAAALETVDMAFYEIKKDISSLESDYGAYMTDEQLKSLVTRMEIANKVDTDNPQALHRLARAYVALGRWDAVERLFREKKFLVKSHAGLLRNVGLALCKKYADDPSEGRALLVEAMKISGDDVETLCALGGTYFRNRGKDEDALEKALDYYRRAHHADPGNPYPLGNYIACELLARKDMAVIDYFRPLIGKALYLCKKQVEVKTNLPWAFYDLGMFNLYLGDPGESLKYYAKAIKASTQVWMVTSGRSRIQDFIDNGILIEHSEAINTFLKTGEWIMTPKARRNKRFWRTDSCNPFFNQPQLLKAPVLIVAGGCGNMEERYRDELRLFGTKLKCFGKGTIISGGTRSGVAQIAGSLQKKGSGIYTIGYAPCRDAVKQLGERLDIRYKEHRHTAGTDFSFLEPIAFWSDFISAGGDPQTVKLVGFNGGRISACEYAAALAFGARAGIIRNSGREADALINDGFWKECQAGVADRYDKGKNLFVLDLHNSGLEQFLKME